MANQMSKRLMGVCSIAVTAVYAAGYLYTLPSVQANAGGVPSLAPPGGNAAAGANTARGAGQSGAGQSGAAAHTTAQGGGHSSAAAAANATESSSSAATTTAQSGSAKSTSGGTNATSSVNARKSKAGSQPVHKKPARHATLYKDGSYTGAGSNPYGTLAVSLTVANGRISAVKITQYNMHYPQSIIDPQLPREAVSMQTWRIYIITGATASTYNFAEAVYNALQKAKA